MALPAARKGTEAPRAATNRTIYAGATLNSPWKDVTFGAAFDYVQNLYGQNYIGNDHLNDYILGLYNTIKATDKLSFNSRGEYWYVQGKGGDSDTGGYDNGIALTETVQYDIYANVISRLEFRYDHVLRSVNGSGYYVLPNGAETGYYSDNGEFGSYNRIAPPMASTRT